MTDAVCLDFPDGNNLFVGLRLDENLEPTTKGRGDLVLGASSQVRFSAADNSLRKLPETEDVCCCLTCYHCSNNHVFSMLKSNQLKVRPLCKIGIQSKSWKHKWLYKATNHFLLDMNIYSCLTCFMSASLDIVFRNACLLEPINFLKYGYRPKNRTDLIN